MTRREPVHQKCRGDTPCIEWTGYVDRQRGYGGTWFDGVWARAHRAAYCQANSLSLADIEGRVVMHRCDNPPCVNPAHLRLGSQLDNIRDRDRKGRTSRGRDRPNSKLFDVTVWYIKARYAMGGKTISDLAREFGVSRSVVSRIVSGKSWSHI